MDDFHGHSVLVERNVNEFDIKLSFARVENAGNKTNVEMIFHKIYDGFKKLEWAS